jgi:DNA-binding NarL/FixJ family response regulator
MTNQPTRILCVTDQPALVMNLREMVRVAGFAARLETRSPRAAFAGLGAEDAMLVFVDAKCAATPERLAQAVRRSPDSRFVLAGSAIRPEMFLVAMETGMHGALATGLAVEEAAEALERIWRGERQFRFDCSPPTPAAPPPPADCADFDSAWMFGQYV